MSEAASSGAEPADYDSHEPIKQLETGFLTVLRNRGFRSIWAAQIASQTAQNTLWFVLIVMVADITGKSTLSIGTTIILVQLPTVLFSSVSGVLVDLISKRAVLIGTNVIRVGGVFAYIFSEHHLYGLFAITFFVAVISQPFAPAEGSSLPLLVDGEELIAANSLFQTTFLASQAVGFAMAPLLIGLFGITTTLLVLAGLFAFAALVLIPLPAITRRRNHASIATVEQLAVRIYHDLIEVMRFVIHDPPLALALIQIAIAPTLLLLLAEIGPNYLAYNLGLGNTSTSLFLLLAPAGLGVGIGMFILGHWGNRIRKERLILVSMIALGVCVIGLASVPGIASFWQGLSQIDIDIPHGVRMSLTMAPIAALMGIEVAFINAPVQTIVQQRAPTELRGRVLALQQTLTAAVAIPPLIVIGGLASLIGTPATLSLIGLVLIAIGLAIVYLSDE